MNVIEYFDQVRIINTPSRKDRRAETQSEFERYGFNINTEKVKFFDGITFTNAKGFPNPGVRGCFHSHLNVLKNAELAKSTNVLILEDDIQFSKNIINLGTLAVESLSVLDWDIAYLGHDLTNPNGELTWKKVTGPMLRAHFYCINGKTIARLVHFLEQIPERPVGHVDGGPMHYDGALNTFINSQKNLQVYYFSSNLGYQRPSKTNLHASHFFDSFIVLKPLVSLLRKCKRELYRITR